MTAKPYPESDLTIWLNLFGVKTLGLAIALTEIKAEGGDPTAVEKITKFRNAKALRRMTR